MRIPFIPFPLEKAIEKARPFRKVARKLVKKLPSIRTDMVQAHMEAVTAVDYVSVVLFSTAFWFSAFTGLMAVIVFSSGEPFIENLGTVFMVSVPVTALSFFYLMSYPHVQALHRTRMMEGELLFALRHLLISAKSGVTLFDAMASVAKGGYGIVSKEFQAIVKEIHSGTPEDQVLERAALENPSPHLRSAVWQISNSLKAGSDIVATLETIVKELERDQRARIRKYSNEMNPWTMMYMMLAVIVPSLGITFLMVLSGFAGISVGAQIFYLIVIFIIFFQVFFLTFMKTKRPMIGV
jgi:pilus assembly protein TadC